MPSPYSTLAASAFTACQLHSPFKKELLRQVLGCCLVQEAIRGKMGGNATAFSTVVEGQYTLHSGDALRLATKPMVVGRALYFVVGQVGAASP